MDHSLSIKSLLKSKAFIAVLLATVLLCLLAFAIPNFATANQNESADAQQNASTSADEVTRVQMYRIYNSWTGEHFYTSDATERDNNVKVGWTDEGVEWIAPSVSDIKVYRLYNPYVSGGDHHYTIDEAEYNTLAASGWQKEGIAWYGVDKDEDGAVPLYRQYNPFATTGTHNYTKSTDEQNNLIQLGWKAEGVGWYGYTEMKTPIDFSKVNISPATMTYTGKQLKPTVTIPGLKQGTDFTVTYGTNITAGTGAGSVTITGIGSKSGSKTVNFTINKANPKYSAPGTLDGVQEQLLSQIKLPTATNGTFTWKSPTTKLTNTGTQEFAAIFTPKDTKNYNTMNLNVKINVKALYTVSFVADGVTIDPQKVADGNFAKEPTTPEKEGKTFTGWYKDNNYSQKFDFAKEAITSDVTLYGKWDIVVKFENNSHGNTIEDKTVNASGRVSAPTPEEIGAASGLELDGWYEDEFCTGNKFDFSSTITKNTTLYANWVPAKTGDLQKYWISPSKDITTGNVTDSANQENENYVSAAWNVKKSSAEIDADLTKIAAGDASTIAEYKAFMTNDDYHLYTVWNGSKTDVDGDDDENGFVEARIIEVGSHNTEKEGTTALTFQTTHVLPSAQKMNSADESSDGWTKSELQANLNEFTGSVFGKLNTGFTDKITSPNKSSVALKNGSIAETTSRDKLWIASTVELFGTDPYSATYALSEGAQYTFWKNLGVSATSANPALQICTTRAGNGPLNIGSGDGDGVIWQRTVSNLSTTEANNTKFNAIDNSGKSTDDLASISEGVVLSFCFSGSDVELNFDENGHGTAVASQTVKHGAYATDPSSQAGEVAGLYVEGWYTDPNCDKETKWDFDEKTSAAGPVQLYANWAPAEDGDLQKYWLGNSKWMTPADTEDTVNIANPNYVDGGANRNVYKSSAEIDADIDAIAAEAFNGTADDPNSVTNEWKGYMKSDKYHLYVAWNGTDADSVGASDENKFMECRILEVGRHNSAYEEDTTVTFQATHALPLAYRMNQKQDDAWKGWKNSWLRADMNEDTSVTDSSRYGGTPVPIFTKFENGFLDRIQSVTKYSLAHSSYTTGVVDWNLSSIDKLWLLSYEEIECVESGWTDHSENASGYAYYSAVEGNSNKVYNDKQIKTRAGNDAAGQSSSYRMIWTRSLHPIKYDDWNYSWAWECYDIGNKYMGTQVGVWDHQFGVSPAFAFASKNVTVNFDTQGHGNDVASQSVTRDSANVTDPTAEAGSVDGLTLEGWYTDQKCTTASKWTFGSSKATTGMTLYANWVPATDGDAKAYWMAPSSKITNGNASETANVKNDAYVAANVNVFKSSAEIQADVAKIKAGDADVIAEYKTLMANDEYHLYTAWNGSNTDATGASDENKFVEFRIVEVGAHNAEVEGTSALTFMATHALPKAFQMNSDTTPTSWDTTQIYKELNEKTGSIFSSFNKKFTNAITPMQKVACTTTSKSATTQSANKLWLMSHVELSGTTDTGFANEGSQYAFFADKSISTTGTSNYALIFDTRAGNAPSGATTASFNFLRSPYWRNVAGGEFSLLNGAGTFSGSSMTNYYGIVPAFCF